MGTVVHGSSRTAASEAWELIHELFTAQRPRFLAIASEFELSPPQVIALKQLEPGAPVPMSELASAMRCDASNITGIVDRLEDRGLVRREGAPNDRRVKMLAVTEKGQEVRRRVAAAMSDPPAALAALPAADQRTLRDILRRAVAAGDRA